MQKPLISVIVPAYNHDIYILECIDSIISQTYKNIELIVIDDGSKDTTFEKLEDIKDKCNKRFVKCIFIKQTNQGVIKTLNTLINLSKGEYIYIIASDDKSKPEAIECLYNEITSNSENVLAVGDNEIIDKYSNPVSWDDKQNIVGYGKGFNSFWEFLCFKRPELKDLTKYGSYDSLIKGNYVTNGYLIKKESLIKIGLYNEKANLEDLYLCLQLSKIGRFCFIPKVLFSYRWHGANQVTSCNINDSFRSTLLYEEALVSKDKTSDCYKKFKSTFSFVVSLLNIL